MNLPSTRSPSLMSRQSVPSDKDILKSRGNKYRLLIEPFLFPTAALTEQFISGEWGQRLAAVNKTLNLPSADMPTLKADQDDYSVEFISLFEVGMGGAPCPLHSGHYSKDRMRTLEEVVRFYQFFEFKPDRSPDRFPDHITFELEFMAHLADLQSQAITRQGDIESPLRAQRDFITRHLTSWLPQLSELVVKRSQIQFFSLVVTVLIDYVAADQLSLETGTGEMNLENSGAYQHG